MKKRYAMATSWAHKIHEYERRDDDTWSLAALRGVVQHPQLGRCYIGSWVQGIGFINVLFPEDAVRPCTKPELEEYTTVLVESSFAPSYRMLPEEFLTLPDMAALPIEEFES
jgi:hypothetical protein